MTTRTRRVCHVPGPVPAPVTGPGLAQMSSVSLSALPSMRHRERRQASRGKEASECASSSASQHACWRQRLLLPTRGQGRGRAVLGELDGRTDVLVHGRVRVHREAGHRGRNRARRPDRFGSRRPPNREGAHVRLDIEGRVDLYEASGPPWDVQLGAFVGTWTYSAHQVEQYNPGRQRSAQRRSRTGRSSSPTAAAAMLKIGFTLVFDRDGRPRSCSSPRRPAAESDVAAERPEAWIGSGPPGLAIRALRRRHPEGGDRGEGQETQARSGLRCWARPRRLALAAASSAPSQAPRSGRHVPRRLGGRPTGSFWEATASTRPASQLRGVRDLLEPARPHARRLQPRRRLGRAELVPDLAVACRPRRTAAARTRSGSSAASGSGRRSTARSPRATSATRSSVSPGRERLPVRARVHRYPRVRCLPRGQGEVDLRHRDAEREDDRLHPDAAGRRLPSPRGAARGGPDPAGGGQVLRGQARRIRLRPGLVGPLHDRRVERGQDRLVRRDQADARDLATQLSSSATRATTRDGQQGGAGEQPRPVRLRRRPATRRHRDRQEADRRRARGRLPAAFSGRPSSASTRRARATRAAPAQLRGSLSTSR